LAVNDIICPCILVFEPLCIFAMFSVLRRSSATSPDFVVIVTAIPFSASATETSAPGTFIGQLSIIAMFGAWCCDPVGWLGIPPIASATATVTRMVLIYVSPSYRRNAFRLPAHQIRPLDETLYDQLKSYAEVGPGPTERREIPKMLPILTNNNVGFRDSLTLCRTERRLY
jgi:hypothetical protein